MKRFTADDFVVQVVTLLDGSRTVAEIERLARGGVANGTERVREALGEADGRELVREVLGVLAAENILSKAQEPAFAGLGAGRADFYDRQLRLLQDFCDEGLTPERSGVGLQRRLDAATAVVLGIGGLGGWVALSLAGAGVGRIRICDFDRVEASNLTRQVLFGVGDVGAPKVDAAATRLRSHNSYVEVTAVNRRITGPDDLADLVDGADVVINAADQPTANDVADWVAAACWPRVPHIMGTGYAYHIGVLGTSIIPGRTACWACVRAETFADHGRHRMESLVGKREKAGAMGALCGLVGNVLAWEAIRIITGLPPALGDRWSEIDFWPLEIQSRAIPKRPDCPVCGP
ncbi:HesA/MoeB/ThiF family protein [Nonomuraea jiangxiensis]|uniref:HesA/MoeB/ThiF family protein n=1 Tax=Nonomuraea jiangxiensis TaxID=633440 RepID=UPI00115FC1C9|nr:ThiF family adenylyltransferase [Nonomuraea jiangxiensis]